MQSDVICWFLLTLFIGVFADKKAVEQDSLVLLFENVTADNAEKDVSLFVNGEGNASLIATFKFVNGHISLYWKADNYKKIFMDATRNIWIANIDETYMRKFYIQSSKKLGEVELTILKINYSTTVRTALNKNTQKGNALPETSYSTTERTPQKETTQKGDALSDRRSSDTDYVIACIVLLVFLIVMVMILIVLIMKKDHRFAWILCKKSNSVPQPVQFIFHHDSPDSTSYKLMWYKPDDGGSPLIKYIIRYCEVEINQDGTEYELSKPFCQFVTVEILPPDVSYILSPLKPGSYYQVEVQAVNTIGMSSERFIFKTKESAPKQAVEEGVPQPVQVTSHRDSPDSTSYQLMWDKPDDGRSPLLKYIIRYCEVEIIPDGTEYELSKYLKPFESVDNILPSVVSYKLSPLTPQRYYLVEIQAINTQGRSLKSFIFKTKEGVPQPVQVTSHHDSPDPTSYKLMWDKPDDGGSPLLKYILQYCEMVIKPNGTEYEQLNTVEISPSDVSYTLSSLKPGSYYQVEVKAVNAIGMSSERFIFKTKESAPKQAVKEAQQDAHRTFLIETDKKISKVQRPSKTTVPILPRNDVTNSNDTLPSTSSDEQNSNRISPSTARKLESLDSDSDPERQCGSDDEKTVWIKPSDK